MDKSTMHQISIKNFLWSHFIALQVWTVIMYAHSILFVHVTKFNVLHYHVTPIIMIYVRCYVVLHNIMAF